MMTWLEFEKRLQNEDACRDWLIFYRFRDGFMCPRCQSRKCWPLAKRRVVECSHCGRQVSLTAGTIFHKTRTPLVIWFRVIAMMMTSKGSISAAEVARHFGLRYETAWLMMHKIRSAFDQTRRSQLEGCVEYDAHAAQLSEPPDRRATPDSGALLAVIERKSTGPGRLRMEYQTQTTAESTRAFVERHVHPTAKGREGEPVPPLRADGRPKRRWPPLPRVFSLLRRILLGTHHGAVSPKHYQRYIDEYVFRYNRRRGRPFVAAIRAFEHLWQRSPTYAELVHRGDGT